VEFSSHDEHEDISCPRFADIARIYCGGQFTLAAEVFAVAPGAVTPGAVVVPALEVAG